MIRSQCSRHTNVRTYPTSLWQIYASEDDTTINLTAEPAVSGLPNTPTTLDRGQKLEFYAGGSQADPGDFLVSADKPIAVFNYMTGYGNLPLAQQTGDPAVVQLSPIEQFLPTVVVIGYDYADSYAYLGGSGTGIINPRPQG
jgi:hypothetical protein